MGFFSAVTRCGCPQPHQHTSENGYEAGNGLYSYDGNLYKATLCAPVFAPRSKPWARQPRAISAPLPPPDGKTTTQTNPDAYIRALLDEPNQYMTWQMYAGEMETQLILKNNRVCRNPA